ncbi:Putative thiol oxidoreductase with 2 cytochrome c heme-binding site [Minicystis rosea]|nr:Putative thiol oxidoreductase with 2 cytochrome c heme-binding site [Minicystis rosea]
MRTITLFGLAWLAVAALAPACSGEPAETNDGGGSSSGSTSSSSSTSTSTSSTSASSATSSASSGSGGSGGAPWQPAEIEPGEELPGGATTTPTRDAQSYLQPAANLPPERRGTFEAGLALFDVAWVVQGELDRDGLGPTYVGTSCQGCHFRGGRGSPPPSNQPMTSMLVRLSVPDGAGFAPDPRYGEQIQNRAITGVEPEGWFSFETEAIAGAFTDGTPFELLAPKLVPHDLAFGDLVPDTRLSARVSQSMIGLGLLAAIPEEAIMALEDPDDVDGDGIRGRAQHLDGEMGRFGWKANQVDLRRQNASAFAFDMGITSSVHPDADCPPVQTACAAKAGSAIDISDTKLDAVVFFSHLLAVPHRPNAAAPNVLVGKTIFREIGCASCHVARHVTSAGFPGYPELESQTIFPYTDLLLHDMGEGLADHRPDGEASGRDFRTSPLWGIGIVEDVSGHGRLLHDGRARNMTEAILWHGGEAEGARARFVDLSAADRALLLEFIGSL